MLTQESHKRLYKWHSQGAYWVSLLLLILCLTALPIIFLHELQEFLLPTHDILQSENFSYDVFILSALTELPQINNDFHIEPLPEYHSALIWIAEGSDYNAYYQSINGSFNQVQSFSASDVLGHAHFNFLLPEPYGEYLVGLVGLASLFLVVIGILLHVKWRKDQTTFRVTKSFRLWSSDLHKLIGLWLLPFHIAVTYTGATLGLGGLLIILSALSSFEGNQEAAIAAVLGSEPIASEQNCPMLSVDALLLKTHQHWYKKYGSNSVDNFEIHFYGDCEAELGISSQIDGYLLLSNSISYKLSNGEVNKEIDWIEGSVGDRWYTLLGPLHFGHFADYWGRWLYVLSTLAMIVLILTGLLLWVDKLDSKRNDKKLKYFYTQPALKICLAAMVAVITSSLVIIGIGKLSPQWLNPGSATIIYIAIFSSTALLQYYVPKSLTYNLWLCTW